MNKKLSQKDWAICTCASSRYVIAVQGKSVGQECHAAILIRSRFLKSGLEKHPNYTMAVYEVA